VTEVQIACLDALVPIETSEDQPVHTGGMDGDVVTGGIVIPAAAMTWRFSRGTGPGGQGVNTTDSRVELVVDLAALVTSAEVADRVRGKLGDSLRIVVSTERSQLRNRESAVRRLEERLDAAARPRRHRTPTRRTAGSVRRRLETKRLRSRLKADRREPGEDAS
jgi:ribosome-associated protein